MKSRFTLLLDPAPGETGTGTQLPTGSNAVDLPADTLSALAHELDLPVELFGKAPAAETEAQKQAKLAAAQAATDKAKAEAAAAAGTAGTASPPVEFTAEQTAWLELRATAKTAEEVTALEAQAPAFTDEQWAEVEKAQTAEGGAGSAAGQPKPVEFTAEQTAEVTKQVAAVKAVADQAKADLDAAAQRLQAAEAELAQRRMQPIAVAAMHPLMTADATQLDQAKASAQEVKDWALRNWDGSPAIEAEGTNPAQPAYTAEQVRAAYARADKQIFEIIPAARQYLADHVAANVNAKAVYPELFNPKSAEHQATESVLRRLPGLRTAIPSINTILGDAFVGEKIRALIYAEKPSAEVTALTAALVKADPSLARFMPQLTAATKGKPGAFKLPTKPIVPLARPAPQGGSSFRRPGGKPGSAPAIAALAKASNTSHENEALLEVVSSMMGQIPTVKPDDSN